MSSSVQYTNKNLLSNTTGVGNSFTTSSGSTVSTMSNFGVQGYLNGSVSVTTGLEFAQTSGTSSLVTISNQSSRTGQLSGTPANFSPVNHDYDVIYLWLNPVVNFTLNANNSGPVVWNGYGFDANFGPSLDIYPVYVGQLNGHFGPLNQSAQNVLARSWASNQTYPSGQGPGITAADYGDILAYDPFSNPNYAFQLSGNSSPATTTDGRFSISSPTGGAATAFSYSQAAPGTNPISQSFSKFLLLVIHTRSE